MNEFYMRYLQENMRFECIKNCFTALFQDFIGVGYNSLDLQFVFPDTLN